MKRKILFHLFLMYSSINTLEAQNAHHLLEKIDQFFISLGNRITMHRQANDKILRGTDWLAQYDNPRYIPKKSSEKKESDEHIAVKIYGNAHDKELLAEIDRAMRSLEGVHIFSPARQEPGRQPHIPYTIGSYWTTKDDTAHLYYSAFQNGQINEKWRKDEDDSLK